MSTKLYGTSIALPAPMMAGSCDPIDPRILVETKADLTTNAAVTFGTIGEYCKIYEGISVYVSADKCSYKYVGPAVAGSGILLSEVLKESNWIKDFNSTNSIDDINSKLDSKVDKVLGKSLVSDTEITKLLGLKTLVEITLDINNVKTTVDNYTVNGKKISTNPSITKTDIGLSNVTNDALVKRSEMGIANGVATLDANGKVPSLQLPSYVDDIIDVYASYTVSEIGTLSNVVLYSDAAKTKPISGESGKIYQNITPDEPNYQFRWTGTVFAQTGASSVIIGEITGTAYDGSKGTANAEAINNLKDAVYGSSYIPVDLGLPSGLLWANMNLGAKSVDDYGLYYQWGDIIGYTEELIKSREKTLDFKHYKWSGPNVVDLDNPLFTKYCNKAHYGLNRLFTDELTTLEPEDDIVHVTLGGNWRMPTAEETQELFHNTIILLVLSDGTIVNSSRNSENTGYTWDSYTLGDRTIKGYKFISKKDSSKFIYFPSGYLAADNNVEWALTSFWTSSLNTDYPVCCDSVELNNEGAYESMGQVRAFGEYIRPVYIGSPYNFYTKDETYTKDEVLTQIDNKLIEVNTALNTKVDKVSGKGLSTNDYTTAEKNKLSEIERYVLATTDEINAIIV